MGSVMVYWNSFMGIFLSDFISLEMHSEASVHVSSRPLAGAQADDGERRGPVLRRRLSGVRSQGKILLPCR